MTPNDSNPPSSRRRRWQFSLGTLLALVTVASLLLGTVGLRLMQARRQHAAVSHIEQIGGVVIYEAEAPFLDRALRAVVGNEAFDFGRVIAVDLSKGNPTDEDAAYLSQLAHLTQLNMPGVRLTDQGLRQLAGLTELTYLNLAGAKITTLTPLASSTRLEKLILRDTALQDISALSHMPDLRSLFLTRVSLHQVDVSSLAKLKQLRHLSLSFTGVDADDLKFPRAAPHLSELELIGAPIGDEGAAVLASLASLTRLNISKAEISNEGAQKLAVLKRLRWLDISDNDIDNDGLASLAALVNLEHLSLEGTVVTDDGLVHLQKMAQLKSLNLEGTRLDGPGLAHLAPLKSLQSLNLYGLPITDKDLQALGGLSSLKTLTLGQSESTFDGQRKLAGSIPGLNVVDHSRTDIEMFMYQNGVFSLSIGIER